MRSLMEDGVDKAAQSLTTLEEVLRVAPPDEVRPGAPQARPVDVPGTAARREDARLPAPGGSPVTG